MAATEAVKVHMNVVPELKFPQLSFSPLATSSPRLLKMKKPRYDQSWNSSNGSDSSGNITAQFVEDINVSYIKTANDSTTSYHTALEYVDPTTFSNEIFPRVTREQLKAAILSQKMAEDPKPEEKSAEFYATVTAERILFDRCRTWAGTILMANDDLPQYANYACQDWYMRHTVLYCQEELQKIINARCSFWTYVAPHFNKKGISTAVLNRIFEKNLVRRSSGPRLDVTEVLQLLFASIGTDERQSFQYWFRVLDVRSEGVLSYTELNNFYDAITKMLLERGILSISFDDVITQYCDILKTSEWTLNAFKKNPRLAGRVINGFINSERFLEEETDERMNTDRLDDENFGEGTRTRWQRMLDHKYDNYYGPETSTDSMNTFVKDN